MMEFGHEINKLCISYIIQELNGFDFLLVYFDNYF